MTPPARRQAREALSHTYYASVYLFLKGNFRRYSTPKICSRIHNSTLKSLILCEFELEGLWPNVKNLSGSSNLSHGLNMVSST